MNNNNKLIRNIAICVAVTGVYLLGVINFSRITSVYNPAFLASNAQAVQKQDLIKSYINKYFYKDVEDQDLTEGAYRGIVAALGDPYSQYFTKKEYEDFNLNTTRVYAGIGAGLYKDTVTGEIKVQTVYDNTPAQEAGLEVGDTIVSADGIMGLNSDLDTFVQHLRGTENTKVSITYRRDGEETTVEVTRRVITLPSVYGEIIYDDVAYVEISSFSSNTEVEFKETMEKLAGEGMKYVIYDLRDNPGGMVATVTEILDDILPEGTTVYMDDKNGNRVTYSSDAEHYMDYPCVVLTNENTASASEIFAGAIRDFKWGTLLGTKTLGKGVVQNLYNLPDGSGIKLTNAQYFTPSGQSIHEKGIEPDILLEYEYNYSGEEGEVYEYMRDNQVVAAIEKLKGTIP